MFKALFNIIFNLLATLIQIVCIPLNTIINSTMPNLSTKIASVTSSLSGVFDNMNWAISIIPTMVLETLLFIVTIEIAKVTIFNNTHVLIKVWNLFQKLKFW